MPQNLNNTPSDTTRRQESEPTPGPMRIRTPFDADGVIEIACVMSKKGKLPGFTSGGNKGVLFYADAHGKPLDSVLEFTAKSDSSPGCVLEARVRMKRAIPLIFGIVTALSIWPGVLLTDSLMNTWFGWYPNEMWVTYAWYLPLTVLPLPWMVRKVTKQSRSSAKEHAAETVEKIAKAIDGVIERT